MICLRDATPDDAATILGFIHELAVYEKQPDAVEMTLPQLHDALFGARPRAEALLAIVEDKTAGFAIWFESFNTWTGYPSLYIEDVFITPSCRRFGLGQKIFNHLARLAVRRGYRRMEWSVLDWNEPAIKFYIKLGAEPQSDWTRYRLSGAALAQAAG